jgi:hypothetical protein
MDFAILSGPQKKCHFYVPIFGPISDENKKFAGGKKKEALSNVYVKKGVIGRGQGSENKGLVPGLGMIVSARRFCPSKSRANLKHLNPAFANFQLHDQFSIGNRVAGLLKDSLDFASLRTSDGVRRDEPASFDFKFSHFNSCLLAFHFGDRTFPRDQGAFEIIEGDVFIALFRLFHNIETPPGYVFVLLCYRKFRLGQFKFGVSNLQILFGNPSIELGDYLAFLHTVSDMQTPKDAVARPNFVCFRKSISVADRRGYEEQRPLLGTVYRRPPNLVLEDATKCRRQREKHCQRQ